MAYNMNQDVALGQMGSAYFIQASTTAFIAPAGKVVAQIQFITAATPGDGCQFSVLTPEKTGDDTYKGPATLAADENISFGTATSNYTASNGTNFDHLVAGQGFPVGSIIFGRWKTFTFANVGDAAIVYFSK